MRIFLKWFPVLRSPGWQVILCEFCYFISPNGRNVVLSHLRYWNGSCGPCGDRYTETRSSGDVCP